MPRDFWDMRPVDFQSKVRGFYRRQEYQSRQTREIIAAILNVNRDPKKNPQGFTGEQIWPLSIDEKKKTKKDDKLTAEEINKMTASHFKALAKVEQMRKEKQQAKANRIKK
jgi:hypothetical protein